VIAMGVITNPWVYANYSGEFGGMVDAPESFHQARGIITMPLSSALSNLVPIAGGCWLSGERLPTDPICRQRCELPHSF